MMQYCNGNALKRKFDYISAKRRTIAEFYAISILIDKSNNNL